MLLLCLFFFFQAEDGIQDLVRSRGLGDVYKRPVLSLGHPSLTPWTIITPTPTTTPVLKSPSGATSSNAATNVRYPEKKKTEKKTAEGDAETAGAKFMNKPEENPAHASNVIVQDHVDTNANGEKNIAFMLQQRPQVPT